MTEVVKAEVLPPAMQAVREERLALVPLAKKALEKKGAVIQIQGSKHVTITALTEIAGYLSVSIECDEVEQGADPVTGDVLARASCLVTRADGTKVREHGYASAGEMMTKKNGQKVQKWADWHALASMALTRAKVRALTTMLMPVIAAAGNYTVAPSAAEIMPNYKEDEEPWEMSDES